MLNRIRLGLSAFWNTVTHHGTDLTNPAVWTPMGGVTTAAGVDVTHKSAMGYPPVWRGVHVIVNDVAKLPLYLYQRKGGDSRERAKRHPAYPLLVRRANPFMPAGVFKKTLTYHAVIDGNGYAFVERDPLMRPLGLWPLDPTSTYPVLESIEFPRVVRRLWYVTRGPDGQQRKIAAENVLHIRGLSYDGYMGHSLIQVMGQALGLGIAARQFATLFFGQGLNARGFLVVPQRLDAAEKDDLREHWPKMNAGLQRSHLPVILHGGMDFKPNQVEPDKAQALETRQLEIREAANIVGVRPHKIGDTTKTSFASLEQENRSHLDESIDPWLCTWEEACNEALLTEQQKKRDSHYWEFSRDKLINTDSKALAEVNRIRREMGQLTVNDLLRQANQPTIGPEGDVRHVPGNWTILTDQPPPPPAAPPVPGQEEDDEQADETEPPPAPPADDEEEEESPQNAAGDAARRAAERQLFLHTAGLLVRSESDQVRRAADRETNFLGWCDRYYPPHQKKIANALEPVLRVMDPESDAGGRARSLARNHVEHSRQQLLAAADGDRDGFSTRINALADEWPEQRPAQLLEQFQPAA